MTASVIGLLTVALLAVGLPAAAGATGARAVDAAVPPAGETPSASVRSRILSIVTARTAEGVAVTVSASGRFDLGPVEERAFPPRISVELPGVLPGAESVVSSDGGALARVRVVLVSVEPVVTRVELDLVQRVAYAVRHVDGDQPAVTVILREPPAAGNAGTATARISQQGAVPAAERTGDARSAAAPAQVPVVVRKPPDAGTGGPRPWGRTSLYVSTARTTTAEGLVSSFGEMISSVTYQMPDRGGDGVEYGLDARYAASAMPGRSPRLSVYEGYVGGRFQAGRIRLRAGHMWLNDLGGVGSVAGGLFELRPGTSGTTPVRQVRVGVFGGLEPDIFDAGYATGVRKFGTYVAVDGSHNRRQVVGYVNVRNADLTERSVMTFLNLMPVGARFFLYQAAEYHLKGPAGQGKGGLTYLFNNVRYSPASRVELQGTYNRGRSIDARGVSENVLRGQTVPLQAIEGFLYQSLGGRVTVEVARRVRVYAGYARDTNNRDDAPTGRFLVGGYASNVAGSGLDVAVSDSRINRPGGGYHSSYVSIGRQFGRRAYVSGEFTTSLSKVRFLRSDGILIETRPHTKQFGGTATINLGGFHVAPSDAGANARRIGERILAALRPDVPVPLALGGGRRAQRKTPCCSCACGLLRGLPEPRVSARGATRPTAGSWRRRRRSTTRARAFR